MCTSLDTSASLDQQSGIVIDSIHIDMGETLKGLMSESCNC